jgi:small redox-active disulfide protein 2
VKESAVTVHDVKILGPGCRNCRALERATRQAVEDLGIDATFDEVTDLADIAGYGVLATPGLVVDGTVVSSGRVPSAAEIAQLLARTS